MYCFKVCKCTCTMVNLAAKKIFFVLIILTNLTLEQKFYFNLNFVCVNKASEDDLQKDKRIICWPPFMKSIWSAM